MFDPEEGDTSRTPLGEPTSSPDGNPVHDEPYQGRGNVLDSLCYDRLECLPRVRKPTDFTGENPEEFPIWLSKFETLAAVGGWNTDFLKHQILPVYLTEQAYQIFDKLPEVDKSSYDNLLAAFQRKMGIGERQMYWKMRLRDTLRAPTEAIDKFVCRLHDLARQAYPHDKEDARTAHVNEQFILGSEDEMRFHLLKRGASDDLEENLRMAKLYEAAQDLRG